MADYIDRQAVRDAACRGCWWRIGANGCQQGEPCERLVSEFVTADAADVAPVAAGYWANGNNGSNKCSVCGQETFLKVTPYCPFCGAHMEYLSIMDD